MVTKTFTSPNYFHSFIEFLYQGGPGTNIVKEPLYDVEFNSPIIDPLDDLEWKLVDEHTIDFSHHCPDFLDEVIEIFEEWNLVHPSLDDDFKEDWEEYNS